MYLRCCWSFWSNIYIPVYLTMLLNCLEQYLYAYDVVESYGALSLYLWCWRISWNSMSVLMMLLNPLELMILLNPLEHYFCTYDVVESLGTRQSTVMSRQQRIVPVAVQIVHLQVDIMGLTAKARDGCMFLLGMHMSDTLLISSCNATSQYSLYWIHSMTRQFSTRYLERRGIS